MFISPLCYNTYNYFSFTSSFCKPIVSCVSPAMAWIAFGRMPENPVITPNATTQVVRASGPNKFLQTVTVKPVESTTPTP